MTWIICGWRVVTLALILHLLISINLIRRICVIFFRHIGTTQFQPTGARQAFPCFDEPGLKATFKMSIVRDKKHIALFNMPLNKTEDYKNGRVVDRFQESVKMSTYLVAFVVCDYKSKKGKTKSGVDVSTSYTMYTADSFIYVDTIFCGLEKLFFIKNLFCGIIYFSGYQFSWIKENLHVRVYLILLIY